MKKIIALIVVCILLVLISVAVFAATPEKTASDAASIGRFFTDIHLIIDGLVGLVQPLIGLGVAVMVGLQVKSLRNQKQSKAILHTQNDALSTIQASIAPPKE
jgi:hypothetical protein